MKLLILASLVLAFPFLFSCDGPEEKPAEQPPPIEAKKEYIPVTDFIQSEIRKIDSLPVGILKRTTKNGRSDSGFIKTPEFRHLANEFLPRELSKETFERAFTESSFFDQTTESLTFTYQSTDPGLSVRRVDVLLSPSLETDKVRNIYMEKNFSRGDTIVNQKMVWKAGSHFSIITVRTPPGKAEEIQQIKVTWDPLAY